MCITYEYQSRVQIFIILLHEFLVVLLGLLAVMLVEFGTGILLRKLPVLFLPVRGVNDGDRRDAKTSLPIRWVFAWFPVSTTPQYSSMVLVVIGDRRAVTLDFP